MMNLSTKTNYHLNVVDRTFSCHLLLESYTDSHNTSTPVSKIKKVGQIQVRGGKCALHT